jgi:REP element-mobilizing transposase RayT
VPRPLRVEFPGALYHVTSRGNDRARIFWDDSDRRTFLTALADVAVRERFSVFAYCLMGNHYHLALETAGANLARGMQRLNSSFAQAFNRRHRRVGHLFQGRYHASLIEREPHLLELARYIVLNPVRAGLCNRPEEWRWSSFRATAGLAPAPSFLAVSWLLEHFGRGDADAKAGYRAFVYDDDPRRSYPPARVPVAV